MCATRRSFLGKAAAAAVLTASSLKNWGQQEGRELTTSEVIGRATMDSATAQTYERWIGGTFKVSFLGMARGTLQLANVESKLFPRSKADQANGSAPEPPNAPLSADSPAMKEWAPGTVPEVQSTILWFKRIQPPLIQEVYTLEHDWLGTFDLLLVPLPTRRGSIFYLATLTRFTGRMVRNS